ncbi:DUF924 family protein [Dyella sp. OK004]|uniref:DUF924 family protein n=1 Tax=Dyella sp. OK004 TaxID=1855292 RepID=UPI000B83125B|nr:DUF924 family protein [Dyella sp. OK004]
MKFQAGTACRTAPSDVVTFWRNAGPGLWFAKNSAFDRRFRERFLSAYEATAGHALNGWQASPLGSLALLLLTDQFPRNAFRGTARMYATDGLARAFARTALARSYMAAVDPDLRLFFCLPFAHSEDVADQALSVALNAQLGQPWLAHAQSHQEIIRRFGRFPHRNPLLGRTSTPEEQAFLDQGGFAG